MAPLTGIVLVKKFAYRGDTSEEFSNRYHFNVAPPVTSDEWHSYAHALAQKEATVYRPGTRIVRAYGYNDDSDKPVSVWGEDWENTADEVDGTLTAAGNPMAGDQAVVAEWKLDARDSRGHYIYARKYFHNSNVSGTNSDAVEDSAVAALEAFALELSQLGASFLGGIRTLHHSEPVIEVRGLPWVTTRTLHRRGKRPLVPPATGLASAQPSQT